MSKGCWAGVFMAGGVCGTERSGSGLREVSVVGWGYIRLSKKI